ncbi:MAG: hypothetical protein MMC23_005074 [Stictis urceolatum]|nr:hypothetical protein [Stictis urceolata]
MESPRPTIVLVHGAWHSPANYVSYVQALRTAGYEVSCPHLPTCSSDRPPKASLADDVAVVRKAVEDLINKGQDVVVVMHSYGGVVGTDALRGLSPLERKGEGKERGVKHLVYMCAYMLPERAAVWDVVEEAGFTEIFKDVIEVADDGSTFPKDLVQTFFTGNAPQATGTAADNFERFPMQALQARTSFAAWRIIPATYIFTSNDYGVPLIYQKNMTKKVKAEGVVLHEMQIESHHSPFISHEQEMVEVVRCACLDSKT